MTSMVVYCPAVDDRAEQEELKMLNDRTKASAERREILARAEADMYRQRALVAEVQAGRRAKKEARAEEARRHQRKLGYWIGAGAGMLAVLAWAFTNDFGITAVPVALGAWLLRRK